MDVFVAFEGYTLPSGYVAKELTIVYPNNEYSHYIFKRPNYFYLTNRDQKTVRYITKYVHGINYSDGDVPYVELENIIRKLEEYTIYTYSSVAVNLIQNILPTTVIVDIKELGYVLPKDLPNPNCFRNHTKYRHCSKAKALAIKRIVEDE